MPTLQTPRLTLRMLRESDIDAYAEMCADPDVMRYLGDGQPLARPLAWRNLAMMVGHWSLRGYGLWAAVERSSGVLVGRIGFWNPEGWPGFELGWMLRRSFWGLGYATEGGAGGPAVCLYRSGAAARHQPDPPGERRFDSGCPEAWRAAGGFRRRDGQTRIGLSNYPRGMANDRLQKPNSSEASTEP